MLTGIEVQERSDVLEGQSTGAAGPYERIAGRAHFAVDPKLETNRIISDIDLAPRNEDGHVEFSADLCMLKPRDSARGNGTALFEVPVRGLRVLPWMFNRAELSPDPRSTAHFGDNFLFKQGFTIVWLGWQFDVARRPDLLRLYTPVASQGGRPIHGLVRSEFVCSRKVLSFSLGDLGQIPYTVSDPDDPSLKLTVRDGGNGPRSAIPRDRWQFARDEDGRPVRDLGSVFMADGFEPGRIYELVYTAQDPALVGLGPAAVRDLVSFLKFGGSRDGITLLGDQHRHLKRAILYGASQAGRFVRSFLYDGFNRDEKGRSVFDGAWSHLAGAARGSFNHRFAQPSRGADPDINFFYPTFLFPFTASGQTDSKTGTTEGLLTRSAGTGLKVFFTNTSYEYWAFNASLIHTTLDGSRDIAPLADTRIYLFAGSQHVPAPFPPQAPNTLHSHNPNDFHWNLRALLVALNRWITDGTPPPPSQYPQISRKTLVPLSALNLPKLPDVQPPRYVYQARRLNFGPDFRKARIITIEPPETGEFFPSLVPQVDPDGNETSGIRMPEVEAPLATYAGWNLRHPSTGAAGTLAQNIGSIFPFARTKQERESTGDPRQSIEERYPSREDYLNRIGAAARQLAAGGYLLGEDVEKLVEQARARWAWFTRHVSSQ